MGSISVVLVDDHAMIREGLRSLIEESGNMRVVGEADNGLTAVALARELAPDLVVMDISMPGMNGIDATRQITRAHPGTKVIALSMHSGHSHVAEMLRAGASAYVLKEAAFDELRLAVRAVLSGDSYLSPAVAAQVARVFRNAPPSQQTSPLSSLSERERTVLQHLAEGRSRKEIAAELAISVKSVETHCSAVMRKLGLCNVADLTKYAIREGLTTL